VDGDSGGVVGRQEVEGKSVPRGLKIRNIFYEDLDFERFFRRERMVAQAIKRNAKIKTTKTRDIGDSRISQLSNHEQ